MTNTAASEDVFCASRVCVLVHMYMCVHTRVRVCVCARAWVRRGGEATKVSALRKMISDKMPNQGQFSCTYYLSKMPAPDRNLIKTKSLMRVMFQFSYEATEPCDGCV